jgi:predicted ester cyclase
MNKTSFYTIALASLFSLTFTYSFLVSKVVAANKPDDRSNEMIEAVHLADKAFDENDIEKYLSYLTDDFIHDNVSSSPANKEQFGKLVESFFKAFPGIRNYQKNLLPYENYLVFDECTFEIPLPDMNKTIEIFHMDIVEMEGKKLKVKKTFGDKALMNVVLNKIEPPFLKPQKATIAVPPPKHQGLKPLDAQAEILKHWNEKNLKELAEMFDTDAEILVSPLFSPVDRSEYVGWQELFFKAFPDLNITAIQTFAGDDWAISEIELKGTNTGPYINNTSTGKPIDLKAGYLTRYDKEGAITSLKLFIDSMKIMQQLELEPVSLK